VGAKVQIRPGADAELHALVEALGGSAPSSLTAWLASTRGVACCSSPGWVTGSLPWVAVSQLIDMLVKHL
jgi:hypothetical protein